MKLFDVQNTPGTDLCAVDAEATYNTDLFKYQVNNFHGAKRDQLVEFSSGHTNLRFEDGSGVPGSGIDIDSRFRNGPEWHPRGRQQLPARIYHAVPDLSRGAIREDSQKFGDMSSDRMTALAGVHIDRMEPVTDRQREMQDPQHIVPQSARSGEDTRQATRTLAYVSAAGFRREAPSGSGAGAWVRSPGAA